MTEYRITSIKILREYLKTEKATYSCCLSILKEIYAFLCQDRDFYAFKYQKLLRITEYFDYKRTKHNVYRLPYIIYKHRKNRLGNKIGLDMGENAFGKGLHISHLQIIVGSATIGENCTLTGQNCIGSGAVIGNNCRLCNGAKVYGPARLADNITVAAGAVVLGHFDQPGMLVGGGAC